MDLKRKSKGYDSGNHSLVIYTLFARAHPTFLFFFPVENAIYFMNNANMI
mgnify:CR=1 FL=1